MPKKTLVLIILLLIIVLGLLYMLLSPKTKDVSFNPPLPPATPTSVAKTTLSFSKDSIVISSRSATADIVVNSNGQELTALQFEMSYDPKTVVVSDITPGDFFTNPTVLFRKIDPTLGKLSYMLAIPPTGTAKNGTGTIAVISFNTTSNLLSGKSTEFTFLPKTLVTAKNIKESVLEKTTGLKIFYLTEGNGIGPIKPTGIE